MPTSAEATRILLVDDDQELTEVLKVRLQMNGYLVDAFNDPVVALNRFVPEKYDVAVLDFRMQPMDGLELYRRLRKLDNGLVMCFLTAYANEIEDKPAGVAFLEKPITTADLISKLQEIEALV